MVLSNKNNILFINQIKFLNPPEGLHFTNRKFHRNFEFLISLHFTPLWNGKSNFLK